MPDAPSVAADPTVEGAQRNRFLEIMRTKAELMDDAQLEAAIEQAEAEIQNLQASRMLSDACTTLLRLIETYPETPAAQDARRMLGLEAEPANRPIPDYGAPEPSFTFPSESTGFDDDAPALDSSP